MIIKLRDIDNSYAIPISVQLEYEDVQAWYCFPINATVGGLLTFYKWAWERVA